LWEISIKSNFEPFKRVGFVGIVLWITYYLTQWLKAICGDGKKYEI
jgi:hypothetical protein